MSPQPHTAEAEHAVTQPNRRIRWILLGLALVLLVATGAAVVWAATPYGPMPEAEAALLSDAVVQVDAAGVLTFTPVAKPAVVGLIFYPGARVAPAAYAPAARSIAEEGFLVIITPMPLNLAVLAPNRAEGVIADHPEIHRWAIGGHSLGGAMAARFALGSEAIDGLLLWAAYPAQSDDLRGRPIEVTSIYATQDGLATPAEVLSSAERLPSDARFVEISGGNHAQFGWYGPQPGDQSASISRVEQQRRIVQASVELLQRLAGGD